MQLHRPPAAGKRHGQRAKRRGQRAVTTEGGAGYAEGDAASTNKHATANDLCRYPINRPPQDKRRGQRAAAHMAEGIRQRPTRPRTTNMHRHSDRPPPRHRAPAATPLTDHSRRKPWSADRRAGMRKVGAAFSDERPPLSASHRAQPLVAALRPLSARGDEACGEAGASASPRCGERGAAGQRRRGVRLRGPQPRCTAAWLSAALHGLADGRGLAYAQDDC